MMSADSTQLDSEDWKRIREDIKKVKAKRLHKFVDDLYIRLETRNIQGLTTTWLTDYQVRMRLGNKYLDYYPTTRKIVMNAKLVGHGLDTALKLLTSDSHDREDAQG
jgi:tRNA(Met) C34 N-acetyltransferase TmcA